MKRLTADAPTGNFETMLNFVHGKDGWAHIYDEDGKETNLITWTLNQCHDRVCDDFQCRTLEEYDEELSSCMMDHMSCPIAMAYCFASQAVHLRSRLKMYEDTGLTPEEIKKLIPPPNAPLTLEELREMDGEPVWCEILIKSAKPSCYAIIHDGVATGFVKGKRISLGCDKIGGYGLAWFAYRRRPEEGTEDAGSQM